MLDSCKFCGCKHLMKRGFIRGKQRYRCHDCRRHQTEGDKRLKYDNKIKRLALIMYLNSCGFRSIGRVLDVPFQLVHYWIKKAGEEAENTLYSEIKTSENIAILEMDELYTFIQKNRGTFEFGWLLIGTEMRLLQLTSAAAKVDKPTS